MPFYNDRRVGVVEHIFAHDREHALAAFRDELFSGAFDAGRRDLAALSPKRVTLAPGMSGLRRPPIRKGHGRRTGSGPPRPGRSRLLRHFAALDLLTRDGEGRASGCASSASWAAPSPVSCSTRSPARPRRAASGLPQSRLSWSSPQRRTKKKIRTAETGRRGTRCLRRCRWRGGRSRRRGRARPPRDSAWKPGLNAGGGGGPSRLSLTPAVPGTVPDQKNSPSRFRFRPPLRPTFGFRLRPPGGASTYSRSVLGARGNLDGREGGRKGLRRRSPQIAETSLFHIFHRSRTGLWASLWEPARGLGTGERLRLVDPARVPEEEPAGLRVAGGEDLRADVLERVVAAEGEVLQPRDDDGLAARGAPAGSRGAPAPR